MTFNSLKMLITFKTNNDQLFKMEVDSLDTIKVLKEKLKKHKGYEYNLDAIKLLFAGKIMDDAKKLNDYKFTAASFIVIMLPRPKGFQRDSLLRTPSQQMNSQPPSTKANALEEFYEHQDSMVSITDSETGPRGVDKSHRHSNASSETGAKGVPLVQTPVSLSPDKKTYFSQLDSTPMSSADVERQRFLSIASSDQSPQELSEVSKQEVVSNWLENLTSEQPSTVDELADPGVQTIVGMGFEQEKAISALARCSYNVQAAVDYLLADRPQVQEQEPRTPTPRTPTPRTPTFVPLASIMPRTQRLPRTDEIDEVLELFRKDEKFQNLRILCHAHPDTLSSALEGYKSEHSDLEWVFEAFAERIVELLTEPVEGWNQYSSAISMETATHDSEIGFDPLNSDPTGEKSELQNEVLNEERCVMMSMETSGSEIPEKDSNPDRLLERVADEVRDVDPGLHSDVRLPSDGDNIAGSEVERERIDDEEEEKLSKDLIAAILMEEEQEQEREQEEEDEQFKDADNSSSSEGMPVPEPSTSGFNAGSSSRTPGRPKTLEELGYVRVTVEEKQAIDRLKSLGFSEDRVVQIFLACDRNEELAANILLDK